MAFGERLRELRNEKGLRQEDVGKIVGVVKSAVSQWESGERTPDAFTLQNLADYFSVTIDYLLGRTDISRSPDDPRDPTPTEIEKVIRDAQINFDGAPLTDEDKEDVIGFIKMALRMKKRKQQK